MSNRTQTWCLLWNCRNTVVCVRVRERRERECFRRPRGHGFLQRERTNSQGATSSSPQQDSTGISYIASSYYIFLDENGSYSWTKILDSSFYIK
jgi:hypothetical protein